MATPEISTRPYLGNARTDSFNGPQSSVGPTSLFGNPSTFTAAANTQASDYDKIMQQYSDLTKSFSANPLTTKAVDFSPLTPSTITPQTSRYAQSDDVTRSLGSLRGLVDTGGYSEEDKQNIRERDISPTRSIYANAQQNVERQRALSGGYSPNFNAVTAQMSRDESDKIGGINTAANAGIAQNVAANKLSAASPYAAASEAANAAKTASDQKNADIINQVNARNADATNEMNKFNASGRTRVEEFNRNSALDTARANRESIFGAIQGKSSLYGTTPALTHIFGNQVVQAGQLGQGQQQLNDQKLKTISGFG